MPQKPKPGRSKEKGFKVREFADETAPPASVAEPARPEAFDSLGELPRGYGADTIFLIAQEPHWLFTYWDIDIAKHPGGAAFLRYYLPNAELEGEIEVPFESRNWYVPVKLASADYYVEIGFYRDQKWNIIARSIVVTTPPDGIAASEDFDYATIPFHLSFQRLLDNLESAVRSGEDLLAAVARLQQQGDFSAFGGFGSFSEFLSEDQRALLSALLGSELVAELSSASGAASDVEARLRAWLEEHLSSGGASEFLSSFRDTSGVSSAGAFSSEIFGSSWGGAALASWAASLGGSWSQAALASWGQAAASSWSVGGESSAALTAMSSWLRGVQSSWAQAALTSWSNAEVSSWFSAAATTSWGGASETLSSFGERGFFMHVNAEVIFYGGTDPRAKVTINGHPVVLNPDGTFRYHFVFPNADYKIDIVAASPDGVEARSATLDFHRATGKTGVVTDTAQPPLGEPMGRQ